MQARDVMVSPVVTVGEHATVRDVARLLIDQRISAVPVVDGAGKLAGIVTEADLMHRVEAGTQHPYSWWLHFFWRPRDCGGLCQIPRGDSEGYHDARRQDGRARYALA